ncbi:MAG: OsmC family protein [Reichenbachiella sp.]|uniref:OsmC family protein n=1 Tax=Reichenbachiella sp. TaxID=2184521 RepID=UPI0032639BC3
MNEIKANWKGNMSFEANVDGHKIILDADAEVGGQNQGPKPKPLLLVALAGCTGMDVVSLLKKMRVKIDDLQISVAGEPSEEHPIYYKKVKLTYLVKGQDLDKEKIEKAVRLSQERYCGVSYTLQQVAEMDYEIIYSNEEVPTQATH